MPTAQQNLEIKFGQIENKVKFVVNQRLKIFANLVKDELNIDLDKITAEDLKRLKKSLTRLINKAKLNTLSSVITGFFDQVELESVKVLFSTTRVSIDELNKKAINRAELLQQISLDEDLVKIERDLKKRLRKNLKVNKLNKLNKAQRSKLIADMLAISGRQLETATTTAVMGFDRAVTTAKANSVGLTHFKYAGAKDDRNRPFCKIRVGKVYTDKQAKTWKNGQKEPAWIYLGGFSCRHRKVYIANK